MFKCWAGKEGEELVAGKHFQFLGDEEENHGTEQSDDPDYDSVIRSQVGAMVGEQ